MNLHFQDIVTDLNAEGEPLPIRPINEEWIGHKVRKKNIKTISSPKKTCISFLVLFF